MANRRHIGQNRSFSGNSMSVNPWQGGVPPTVSGISQLTDTQAQLALALTNLLRPPALQQSQPLPSLLNLPQINPTSSYGDYNRHNYDYDDRDRYMNRSNNIRRGRFNDKIQNRPSRDRRRNDHHRKSDGRSNNDNSKYSKERSLSKTKVSESKTDNQSEETEDKKRDWKEEKNNGTNQENENNESKSKETDTTNENGDKNKTDESIDKSTDDNKSKDTKTETRNKDGRYSGIPVEYLKCLVCEKSMWDGESFEKHLRGRAHQQMLDSLRETHDVQADMMRQAIRLCEERKAIELNRKKRHGKHVEFRKVTHCNMCDFDFYGREAEHRRSPGHQKLKRFLHPRCIRCRVEFPIKIEWEEHRLSPEHIRKVMETKDDNDAASVDLDDSDDIFEINLHDGDFEEEDNDPENVILDIDDNTDLLTNFDNRIPVYKKSRNVGPSQIEEITGQFCKLCNQFFRNEAKAQAHGKSKLHYDNFIKYLKNKNAEKIKQNEIEEQAKKRSLEEDEGNVEDEDGNWKRRKVSAEDQPAGVEIQDKELKKDDDLYDPMEAEEEDDEEDDAKNDDDKKPVEETSKTVDNNTEVSDTIKSEVNDTSEEETKNDGLKKDESVAPIKKEQPTEENTPVRVTRTTRTSASGRRPGPLSKTRGKNN